MIYEKKLEVRYTSDIIVAGGGAAGVCAAVAAARMGKKVLIVDSFGCFGGLGTSGMVPAFAPFGDGINFLAGGIGREIRENVSKNIPLDTYWTSIDAEELKREYDRIIKESGVDFLFFTTVCDAVTKDGHLEYVILSSPTGLYAAKADVFIDCTGDGALCALAGGKFEIGDANGDVMPPTLCSRWDNINTAEYRRDNPSAKLEYAIKDGVFTYEDRHLPGMFMRENGIGGGNVGHVFGTNPLDERSVSDAMVWGRASMLEYLNFYKNYVGGCSDIRLSSTAPMLGVRESRRITCDYMLGVNDFISRANFDDEIGRYCYPVDIHVMDTSGEEYERFQKEYQTLRYKNGESYGIPYRSLIPVSFDNVLCAGRCMGTDRQMEASIRVMPGCFITGQAAGTAAALSLKHHGEVRKVSTDALKTSIRSLGGWIRE